MWLSDNQSKPLVDLQEDFSDEGTPVLGNYLLPQQPPITEEIGKGSLSLNYTSYIVRLEIYKSMLYHRNLGSTDNETIENQSDGKFEWFET